MTYLLTQLANGISYGLILGMIAVGFVIVFSSTGVLNFAHGSVLLAGVYLVAVLQGTVGIWFAILLGAAGAALLGILVNAILVRNVAEPTHDTFAILTLGVDVFLLAELTRRIGSHILTLETPWGTHVTAFGAVRIPTSRVVAACVAVLAFVLLWFLFTKTRAGVAMRAAAADGDTASLMGIRLSRTGAAGWALAGLLATLAGVFLTSYPAPGVAPAVTLSAMAAIPAWILGGFNSVPGAVVGGLVIGIVGSLAAGYESELHFLGEGLGEVVPFLVMFVLLLVRPQGLFGRKEAIRV